METLSIRVPTHLMERIEDYGDELGETRSLAARELITTGLDVETGTQEASLSYRTALAWVGTLLIATQIELGAQGFTGDQIALAGAALVLAAALSVHERIREKLTELKEKGESDEPTETTDE